MAHVDQHSTPEAVIPLLSQNPADLKPDLLEAVETAVFSSTPPEETAIDYAMWDVCDRLNQDKISGIGMANVLSAPPFQTPRAKQMLADYAVKFFIRDDFTPDEKTLGEIAWKMLDHVPPTCTQDTFAAYQAYDEALKPIEWRKEWDKYHAFRIKAENDETPPAVVPSSKAWALIGGSTPTERFDRFRQARLKLVAAMESDIRKAFADPDDARDAIAGMAELDSYYYTSIPNYWENFVYRQLRAYLYSEEEPQLIVTDEDRRAFLETLYTGDDRLALIGALIASTGEQGQALRPTLVTDEGSFGYDKAGENPRVHIRVEFASTNGQGSDLRQSRIFEIQQEGLRGLAYICHGNPAIPADVQDSLSDVLVSLYDQSGINAIEELKALCDNKDWWDRFKERPMA